MSELRPIEPKPLDEVLNKGDWYRIAGGNIDTPEDGAPMQLWLEGIPTEPGYYPRPQNGQDDTQLLGYRADFYPVHNGWRRYVDTIASFGFIREGELEIPAYITNWPSPEFMDPNNKDPHWFLLRYEKDVDQGYIEHWRAEEAA